MSAHIVSKNSSNNIYLSQLFDHLSDPDMLITFLCSIEFAIDHGIISDTFLTDFVLMTRVHQHSHHIITVLTEELLKTYHFPHEIFRADHMYIRILKEFVIQSLGKTLVLHLAPIITRLNLPLTPYEIAECATQLLKRLSHFRFPSETKAFFLTLASIIGTRFAGHEWKGLSGIFFLRYLCPLVMTSPTSFHIEPSEEYAKNSIQLAKLIQNLANGLPSEASPEFLLISMENQHLIEEFLRRLASATNLSGFEVPSAFFSNIALISYPSNQSIHQFIDQVIEVLYLYHEQRLLLLSEKWVKFSVSWRRFASTLDDSTLLATSSERHRLQISSSAPLSSQRDVHLQPKKRHWRASLLRLNLRSASSERLGFAVQSPPDPPLVSQRRYSASSLMSSPRSELKRLELRLQISAVKNLLSKDEATIVEAAQQIIELLGTIAQLFGELADAPEIRNHSYPVRKAVFEFAQIVERFVAALNARSDLDTHVVQLEKILSMLENQYLLITC